MALTHVEEATLLLMDERIAPPQEWPLTSVRQLRLVQPTHVLIEHRTLGGYIEPLDFLIRFDERVKIYGEVLLVGSQVESLENVKVGDFVFVTREAGDEIDILGTTYHVYDIQDTVAVIEGRRESTIALQNRIRERGGIAGIDQDELAAISARATYGKDDGPEQRIFDTTAGDDFEGEVDDFTDRAVPLSHENIDDAVDRALASAHRGDSSTEILRHLGLSEDL